MSLHCHYHIVWGNIKEGFHKHSLPQQDSCQTQNSLVNHTKDESYHSNLFLKNLIYCTCLKAQTKPKT